MLEYAHLHILFCWSGISPQLLPFPNLFLGLRSCAAGRLSTHLKSSPFHDAYENLPLTVRPLGLNWRIISGRMKKWDTRKARVRLLLSTASNFALESGLIAEWRGLCLTDAGTRFGRHIPAIGSLLRPLFGALLAVHRRLRDSSFMCDSLFLRLFFIHLSISATENVHYDTSEVHRFCCLHYQK